MLIKEDTKVQVTGGFLTKPATVNDVTFWGLMILSNVTHDGHGDWYMYVAIALLVIDFGNSLFNWYTARKLKKVFDQMFANAERSRLAEEVWKGRDRPE